MLNRIMLALIAGAFILSAGATATAQTSTPSSDDAAKLEQIKRMADALGFEKFMVDNLMNGIEDQVKQLGDQVPSDFSEGIKEKIIEKFDEDEFLSTVILPVMTHHFTADELKLIADFVESDLGEKIIASEFGGEEADVEEMITSGDLSQEELMSLMPLVAKLGSKKDLFADGTISDAIEEGANAYFTTLVTELMMEFAEEFENTN